MFTDPTLLTRLIFSYAIATGTDPMTVLMLVMLFGWLTLMLGLLTTTLILIARSEA